MKPNSFKASLAQVNDNFLLHRKVCEVCRSHAGVCKTGVTLLLKFSAVIQAEIERERQTRLYVSNSESQEVAENRQSHCPVADLTKYQVRGPVNDHQLP
jgi:hypothetical protein